MPRKLNNEQNQRFTGLLNKIFHLIVRFLSALLLVQFFTNVEAIPRRGNEPWSLILCKFKDNANYEPRPKEWFKQWLDSNEPDSIENYFAKVSNGIYTIKGSDVHGWFTMKQTQNDVLEMMAHANLPVPVLQTINSEGSFEYFDKVKELCYIAALESGAKLHPQRITIVNSGTSAVYGKTNGVLLTPQLIFSSVLTHEMVHSFFIGHSYSDRKIKVFPYATTGEYDDRYDLMSTANAYMHKSKFGMSGPGLNGAHLDFLGWLPMDRVLLFGKDGRRSYTLRLSSLSTPHNMTLGWLLVIIPYDRDDPHNYYTVELRTPRSFDKGIMQASVLIHQVQKIGLSYYSMLLSQANDFYELTENTEWVKFLGTTMAKGFQMVRVSVKKLYENDVDISISSTFEPNECLFGEKAVRPNTLVSAHYRLEHLCLNNSNGSLVTRSIDNLVRYTEEDIRKQYARRNFFEAQRTFGANSCRFGYTWRRIDPYDFVCVTQRRYDMVLREVGRQDERVDPNDETICLKPFLPRRAFPGDEVCVTPAEKFRIFRENLQSSNALKNFAFFNGVDTVGT